MSFLNVNFELVKVLSWLNVCYFPIWVFTAGCVRTVSMSCLPEASQGGSGYRSRRSTALWRRQVEPPSSVHLHPKIRQESISQCRMISQRKGVTRRIPSSRVASPSVSSRVAEL